MRSNDRASHGPQGHGFMAATNMKEQGKVMVPEAREIVTFPSSSGFLYQHFLFLEGEGGRNQS